MSWGRRGGGRRKMGYEGTGTSSRAKRVDSRISKGGVEYTWNALTGRVTCTMCGTYGAAEDLAFMLDHAKVHRPEEVARVAALARVTAALEQLDAGGLDLVAEVLPAIVANPVGFRVVARALASGALKHPGRGLGPSPDQTADEHVQAGYRHADRAMSEWPPAGSPAGSSLAIDADTGLPHAGLFGARGVLAVQREDEERRR